MICELVKQGKKIGVTATQSQSNSQSLEDVVAALRKKFAACIAKTTAKRSDGIAVAKSNDEALDALRDGQVDVVGGTSWLWSCAAAFESVDVFFVDEAGQMSLADTLAVSQSARNMVLLGDPQQLDRPIQGAIRMVPKNPR